MRHHLRIHTGLLLSNLDSAYLHKFYHKILVEALCHFTEIRIECAHIFRKLRMMLYQIGLLRYRFESKKSDKMLWAEA